MSKRILNTSDCFNLKIVCIIRFFIVFESNSDFNKKLEKYFMELLIVGFHYMEVDLY